MFTKDFLTTLKAYGFKILNYICFLNSGVVPFLFPVIFCITEIVIALIQDLNGLNDMQVILLLILRRNLQSRACSNPGMGNIFPHGACLIWTESAKSQSLKIFYYLFNFLPSYDLFC